MEVSILANFESRLFSVPCRLVSFSWRGFKPDTDSTPRTTVDVSFLTFVKGASMRWNGLSAAAGALVENMATACSRTRLKTSSLLFSGSVLIHPPLLGNPEHPPQSNRANHSQPPVQS